jgi:energy-coupling factor transporter transmembrane protein EcfT
MFAIKIRFISLAIKELYRMMKTMVLRRLKPREHIQEKKRKSAIALWAWKLYVFQ